MPGRLFLAGATGAVGRRLAPLLVADGWEVFGTTRFRDKSDLLRSLGVEPVVVDVFDSEELQAAVARAQPTIVVHQLTDLPPGLDPQQMPDAIVRNARLRERGTYNLIAAAAKAGVERLIAQSVGFAYAQGSLPHQEDDPLDVEAPGNRGISARGVASLEHQVLGAPMTGIVLRYGLLYGPGTGFDTPSPPALHVDAAAQAARLATQRGDRGIYNLAEDDGVLNSDKAKKALGWSAGWRAMS